MFGDINVLHFFREMIAAETPYGKALHKWFEDLLLAPLNDGRPNISARFEQGLTGFSAPDISISAVNSFHRFSQEPLYELNSDRLPLIIR